MTAFWLYRELGRPGKIIRAKNGKRFPVAKLFFRSSLNIKYQQKQPFSNDFPSRITKTHSKKP